MRSCVLASLALLAAFLVACADEDITTPPPTAAAETTAATPALSPEAPTTPEVGDGPVVTYLGEPIGNAGAEALPIEVDSAGQLFMDWNDDGSLLAYVSGGDIWVFDGEESRNLTNTPDVLEGMPVWSKDSTAAGGLIAFASRPFEENERPEALLGPQGGPSWMMADGSDYTKFDEGFLLSPLTWNGSDSIRGSNMIAYVLDGDVRTFGLRGERRTLEFTDPVTGIGDVVSAVSWSPSRDEVAVHYASAGSGQVAEGAVATQGVAILDLGDDRGITVVHEFEGPYVPLPPPQWSAEGERLLITIPPSSAPGADAGLWIADRVDPRTFSVAPPRGDPARRVEGIVPYQARWSPDGERIAVIENGERRILVLDAETLEVIGEPGPADGVAGIAWRP